MIPQRKVILMVGVGCVLLGTLIWGVNTKQHSLEDHRKQGVLTRSKLVHSDLTAAAEQGDPNAVARILAREPGVTASDAAAIQRKAFVQRLANAAATNRVDEVRDLVDSVSEAHSRSLREPIDVLQAPCWKGYVSVVRHLLTKGWHPDGVLRNGTPLSNAVSLGRRDVTALLLRYGANPNLGDSLGDASAKGRVDLALHLINSGACVDAYSEYPRWQPPRFAQLPTAQVRLPLTGENHPPSTPLQLAVSYNHPATVNLLVAHGAAIERTSADGKTALTLAEERGLSEIATILKRARKLKKR